MAEQISQRHHTVPRFYLKRFADYDERVWVYDRTTENEFVTSTLNVCVERDFHSLDIPGGPPDQIENLLGLVEQELAEGFANLGTRFPPTAEAREKIAAFMVLQFVRSPRWREVTLRTQADMHKHLLLMTNEMAKTDPAMREWMRSVMDPEMDDDHLNETIQWGADGDYEVEVPIQAHLEVVVQHLGDPRLAEMLIRRPWSLVMAPAGQEFVTSDEPVILTSAAGESVGLGTAEHIYFPLDRQRLLVLGWHPSDEGKRRDPDARTMASLNEMIVRNAGRWVIGHSALGRGKGRALVGGAHKYP